MQYLWALVIALFTTQNAYAMACDYSGVISFGKQTIQSHECWDLSGWPADKAAQFCSMMGFSDGGEDAAMKVDGFGAKQMSSCPAGSVARCQSAQFRAPGSAPLDDAYYAQFPEEMRAEIKANAEAYNADMNSAFAPFSGLKATVHYYPDASGFVKVADQKADCEQTKGGVFTQ